MNRPRTGHRPHQAGSITVVDLIRRQPVPIRIPSADELGTSTLVTELLGPETGPGRPRSTLARAGKLLGLAAGSMVLCGSVIAASTYAHAHQIATPTTVAATGPITGLGALRPDMVEAQVGGRAPAAPAAEPHRADKPAVRAAPVASAPDTAPAAPPSSSPVQIPPLASPADVVREFYQLVNTEPTLAERLVDPSLLEADAASFATAWESVRRVDVESIQTNPDGSIQAVIRMLDGNGGWTRIVERLRVREAGTGTSPVISDAELLSAQRG